MTKKMTKKQTSIALLAITLIIAASGILSWHLLKNINTRRLEYSELLFEEYRATGKKSDIFQAVILNPNTDHDEDILSALLEEGDYENSKALNNFLRYPKYNLLLTEHALFNLDFKEADEGMQKLPPSTEKTELIAFKSWLTSNNPIYELQTTETDAGKLMAMVEERNFYLTTLESNLGKEIEDNNSKSSNILKSHLLQAKTLANHGYLYPAIMLLEENDYNCNKHFYLLTGDIYNLALDNTSALKQAEKGLMCNSADKDLLASAIRFANAANQTSKAKYYQSRLNYLTNLAN